MLDRAEGVYKSRFGSLKEVEKEIINVSENVIIRAGRLRFFLKKYYVIIAVVAYLKVG